MPTTARVDRMGGFAAPAQRRSTTVSLDALAAADRETGARLLAAAQPHFAAATATREAPIPDATYVRVVVDRDGAIQQATWSERALPPPLRELARWIEAHAQG